MRKLCLSFSAIVFGALRGIEQGMVMSMTGDALHTGPLAGIRGHEGFGIYHLVNVLVIAVALSLVMQMIWKFPGWMCFIGILFLIWEATELGYNFSRYGEAISYHEHVNFMDVVSFQLEGLLVYCLHCFRAVTGIVFILKRRSRL